MLAGSVINDEIDDHSDPTAVRLVDEFDEVAERPVALVHAEVVGDVVAVVAVGRWLKRGEPDRADAERFEVVEPATQPFEVAATIAVTVEERLDVKAVENRVFVPEVGKHGRCAGSLREGERP
jgi:hypothetical protein